MRKTLSTSFALLLVGLVAAPLASVRAQDAAPAMPELEVYDESAETGMGEEQYTDTEGELSVGELQQMLNLPPSARIRKEYQEDLENPPSLFEIEDEQAILRIFGEKPPFVYFPVGVDPMIIPWVRAKVVAEELFEEASIAIANKDYEKAQSILREIREEYPETEVAPQVPEQMERVAVLIDQQRAAAQAGQITPTPKPDRREGPITGGNEVVLPQWVRDNTSAVMIADNKTVLVGNDFLNVGDAVPRYPNIRVKDITTQEVIYAFQDKEFTVNVDGSF